MLGFARLKATVWTKLVLLHAGEAVHRSLGFVATVLFKTQRTVCGAGRTGRRRTWWRRTFRRPLDSLTTNDSKPVLCRERCPAHAKAIAPPTKVFCIATSAMEVEQDR